MRVICCFLLVVGISTAGCREARNPLDAFLADEIALDETTSGAGVTISYSDKNVILSNGIVEIRVDLSSGLYSISAYDNLVISKACSRVLFVQGGTEQEVSSHNMSVISHTIEPLQDALGRGLSLSVETRGMDVGMVTRFDLREDTNFFTVNTSAFFGACDVRILRISPIVADAKTNGALLVGREASKHRILDNGYDLYFDFVAQVRPASEPNSILFAPGHSSNWCMAIYDPLSEKSLIAGFLSSARGVGVVVVDQDGGAAFSRFELISLYMDKGRKPLCKEGKGHLDSETAYVDIFPKSVHEGLEEFARRYARRSGKVLWRDVPSGWNSWGGGLSSGGMGANINEAIILQNLELAVQDFKPYGMKYFMIDDGWQDAKGDWNSHPERFPAHEGQEGMAWMAEQIRKHGMIPGLWISPFEVSVTSRIAQEHPEWWAKIGPLGVGLVPENILVPDLSRPDVLDWVEGVISKVTQQWGYRWLKVDFSYYALFTTDLYDSSITPSEAYRNAMSRIRKAAGKDTFLLVVAATGLTYDLADGNRITLDNMPWWAEDASPFQQGIKPTFGTLSRRYYLNHNLWINHPDLIFFRNNHGLTFEEARAWASVVGLTGGIVKLGETFVSMHQHPAWLETIRVLLPIYPKSARPLDLFEREFPERWFLVVEREGQKWGVLGLFHWGRNRDIGGQWENPELRKFDVNLAGLGFEGKICVFDAWKHTWKWVEGTLSEVLPSHSARVLILREAPKVPSIVFTTRHLLGGAVEVKNDIFEHESGVLSALIETVQGEKVGVFIADAGRSLVSISPEPQELEQKDGIVRMSFTATSNETQVKVHFVSD